MAKKLYMPMTVPGKKTWRVLVCSGEWKPFVTRQAAEACEQRACGPDCRGIQNHDLDRIDDD